MVWDGTNPAQQRHAVCTLGRVAATVQREGQASTAIVVVGDVVPANPLWQAGALAPSIPTAAQARR